MPIKLKAKRIFKNNPEYAVFDIKGLNTPVHIHVKKEVFDNMDEQTFKNVIKNEIYSEMEVVINGK